MTRVLYSHFKVTSCNSEELIENAQKIPNNTKHTHLNNVRLVYY